MDSTGGNNMKLFARYLPGLLVTVLGALFLFSCDNDTVVGSDEGIIQIDAVVFTVTGRSVSSNKLSASGIVKNTGSSRISPMWYIDGEFYADSKKTLIFSGDATIEYSKTALKIDDSDDITFQISSKVSIKNCDPGNYGVITIDDCSPMIRYVEITTENENSSDNAICIKGTAGYPSLYNITIKDYASGIKMYPTLDALMRYSVIDSLSYDDGEGYCIKLYSEGESGDESATIDLSWAYTDIVPTNGNYAIDNRNPKHRIWAGNNWWGNPNPEKSMLFSFPDSVYYSPVATTPHGLGAGKISIPQENPFQTAVEFELAGDYESALEIYYEIIQNETDTAYKRRAIKSIIKINHAKNLDYSGVRKIIQRESAQAVKGYGQILDYLSCEVLIKEKRHEEAVSLLTQKADEYKGSYMEVEMLTRAAMVYGRQMKNKDKVKEYADRVAIINPGEPILDSLYRLAGMTLNIMTNSVRNLRM